MKIGDKVTFMVTNTMLNDYGEFYTMRVKEIFVNGLRLEDDEVSIVAMYEDIKITEVHGA